MENYHILERIGEGSFGKVYRGRRKYSGHIVALKFVTKQGKSARDLENLRQEVGSQCKHNRQLLPEKLTTFSCRSLFYDG
jgi:fused-like protein